MPFMWQEESILIHAFSYTGNVVYLEVLKISRLGKQAPVYPMCEFSGLGSLFLASGASDAKDETKHLFSDSDRRDIYHGKTNFKCPFPFGAFSDPVDCAHFYVCVFGKGARQKCPFLHHFDIVRRRCVSMLVAICGSDKTTSTEAATTTVSTKTGDNFKCTTMFGAYPHPNDCSKYYSCVAYVPILRTCPEDQLFDTVKSSCKSEKGVDCGSRQRPGYTSPISTDFTATETVPTLSTDDATNESIIETNNTKDVIDESTTEAISTEDDTNESTSEVISTEDIITQTVTEINSTTELKPTGPPEHDCDEDDVDCIITETGDIEDWFTCHEDIAAYPHPSSDKLFIFCMNWIPSVKKCGMDRVFSTELSTCIETETV